MFSREKIGQVRRDLMPRMAALVGANSNLNDLPASIFMTEENTEAASHSKTLVRI
jgi:hypothetical protein